MTKNVLKILAFFIVNHAISSCTKEVEILKPQVLTEYYPLKIGNIITYRVDSTVYTNLGTLKVIRSYQMRDRIDSVITDNMGRPSYKVRRSVRSQMDSTKWIDSYSYLVTYDSVRLRMELVENNIRYLKLASPVSAGVQWNGTSFINSNIPELQYMADWRFIYEQVRRPFTVNGISYTETITVNQRNDSVGSPSNKNFYFEKTFSKEVFSKSIGLIYKEFLHEAWQPANGSSASGYYEPNSYGIKLSILSHNF